MHFVMNARIGQHMRVKIVPIATRLITAGEVISPAGKLDGGPGGVIYDADLTESGDYRIRVFQRQNKVVGTFYLEVEIR